VQSGTQNCSGDCWTFWHTVLLCCTEGSRIQRNWTAFRLKLLQELLAAHRKAVELPHPARPSEPLPPLDRLTARQTFYGKDYSVRKGGSSPWRVCSLLQNNWENKRNLLLVTRVYKYNYAELNLKSFLNVFCKFLKFCWVVFENLKQKKILYCYRGHLNTTAVYNQLHGLAVAPDCSWWYESTNMSALTTYRITLILIQKISIH
jgi:hypothetical protein